MSKLKGLRKNLVFVIIAALLVVLNVVLGVALVSQSTSGLVSLMDSRMLDVSNSAAALINGDDLKSITEADIGTDKYNKIFDTLDKFQESIELSYIYCVRKVADKEYEFVVDPDPVNPADYGELVVYTKALDTAQTGVAVADKEAVEDEWGKSYSSFSPVFDSNHEVAGIVGVDFKASWFEGQLTRLVIIDAVIFVMSLTAGILIVVVLTTRQRKNIAYIFNRLNFLADDISSLVKEIRSVTQHEEIEADNKKYSEIKVETVEGLAEKIEQLQGALKEQIEFVHARAFIDSLTGAFNTTAFTEEREKYNKKILNKEAEFAILLFDLNNLKLINDTYGHENGDEILKKAVRVISSVVTGPIYRIGGDEFVVLLDNPYKDTIKILFNEIDAKIAECNEENKDQAELSIAKGSAIFDATIDKNFKDIFRRADEKMYLDKAKYHKKNKK